VIPGDHSGTTVEVEVEVEKAINSVRSRVGSGRSCSPQGDAENGMQIANLGY
jgi:hypothetical protein